MRNFLIIFLFFSVSAFAGDVKYPVSQVPAELLKDANVVVRAYQLEYQIVSLNEAILKTRKVITILNEKGNRFATRIVHYSNLSKVSDFEGALYNGAGELIRKLKSKEIIDQSNVSEISLIDDSRIKGHDFGHRSYPYTVEYVTEEKIMNTYNVPDWIPQISENYSVHYSSFRFIAPEGYVVRYKALNYPGKPVESSDGRNRSYLWEVKNLPVLKEVYAAPDWREITPNVMFAPSEFEMQGYHGNAMSWEEFGKFQIKLHDGRDKLPDNIIEKVKELTSGVESERERVKILFDFLQKNTRYILISFGIGSLQPFEASYVATKGYGDCKALSNYMYSLLKAAGIKSYYALINGGKSTSDRFMVEDFPSHQFNHMVLSVPLQKDTMWLECTSQTDPAGYMGSFTGNRKALLITENGGKLVSTPRYGIKENYALRKLDAKLSSNGDVDMKVFTVYKNTQQDRLNSLIYNYPKSKIKEFLQDEYEDLGTYTINSFDHQIKKDILPEIEESLDIHAYGYATISGKRIFIVPNLMNRQGMRLVIDSTRKFDYVFDSEYKNEDIVTIEIPEGYQLETPFQDINIQSKFGNYFASVKVEGKNIIYRRVREQTTGRYSPKEGEAIAKYYNDIHKADRSKIVFVKIAQ